MPIYGNMIGGGSLIGKTVEIVSDDGADLMGVVVDREQVLTPLQMMYELVVFVLQMME